MGLRKTLYELRTTNRRTAKMAACLQLASTPRRHPCQNTHQQTRPNRGQPVEAPHLERDPSNPAPAEEAFQTALEIAKQQGARSWGLRAALALAKLYQSAGRPVDALAVLAPALEGFSATPEIPEIAGAQALLVAIGAHVRPE